MLTSWLNAVRRALLAATLCGAATGPLDGRAPAAEPPAAKPLIDANFSRGDFAALGWEAKGDWDVFTHPLTTPNHPGAVARFPAHKPDAALTKSFAEVRNPRR